MCPLHTFKKGANAKESGQVFQLTTSLPSGQVCDFRSNINHHRFFLLAMATKMVAVCFSHFNNKNVIVAVLLQQKSASDPNPRTNALSSVKELINAVDFSIATESDNIESTANE